MKKAELNLRLDAANHGHRLLLAHYWVKGVYLVRIIDATGKRYRGGYAVLEDDNSNLPRDLKRLDWLIALRDKVETLQQDLQSDPPEPADDSDLDLDDLDLPDSADLDDLDLPDGCDLRLPSELEMPGPLTGPPIGKLDLFHIPAAELAMARQSKPKPRPYKPSKIDLHLQDEGETFTTWERTMEIVIENERKKKKGGPE
jgi:hypothetical protein